MERQPPLPVCKAFVVCRQIFVDELRNECTLVAPFHEIIVPAFPARVDLSIFARWTNAHGVYKLAVQLRDLAGNVLLRGDMGEPLKAFDPLQVWPVTLRHLFFDFPHPGKFEIAMLANDQEVVADVFWAHLASERQT